MTAVIALALSSEGRRMLAQRAGGDLAKQLEAAWALQSEHKLKAIQEATGHRLRNKPIDEILKELQVWLKAAGVRLTESDKQTLARAIHDGEKVEFRFSTEFTMTTDARAAFREVFPY